MTVPPIPGAEAATVLDRVRVLLAELLRLESSDAMTAESALRADLGIDSLGMVDLVTLLEEKFEIRFATNTDLSEIQTVADVTALVEERIAVRIAG
jgi:acyl carrier protein